MEASRGAADTEPGLVDRRLKSLLGSQGGALESGIKTPQTNEGEPLLGKGYRW